MMKGAARFEGARPQRAARRVGASNFLAPRALSPASRTHTPLVLVTPTITHTSSGLSTFFHTSGAVDLSRGCCSLADAMV
jgi:hypothetical protein